mmetsp:Transcript_19864/g.32956  ORF Transcript_19864/g.32956 Transcript_19864/m.32956 type:complete len:246 (-) Transcript_19864:481-1218(-)
MSTYTPYKLAFGLFGLFLISLGVVNCCVTVHHIGLKFFRSVMRCVEGWNDRTQRYNLGRVTRGKGGVVVVFVVLCIYGSSYDWNLIQLLQIIGDIVIRRDSAVPTLEEYMIYIVKTNQCREKLYICDCEILVLFDQVPIAGKNVFKLVKAFENVSQTDFICILRPSHSTLVYGIIQIVLYVHCKFVNLHSQLLWVKRVLYWCMRARQKRPVQISSNIPTFVRHDFLLNTVKKYRGSDISGIFRIC